MFSFLNRNKTQSIASTNEQNNDTQVLDTSHQSMNESNDQKESNVPFIEDIKNSLYEAILHKRTDIVVSLLNQWFKGDFFGISCNLEKYQYQFFEDINFDT